ncbi:MAG: CvpA family protein [Anaerolineales bacterium]|nr:CvpA family protein [Anaerolineales bacterium]
MMISILLVFYLFLFFFAVMGAMRGWAKELLVIFSVIFGLALINVMETLVPVLSPFINSNPNIQFWLRIGSIVVIAFFGYQSPKIARLSKGSERRDKIQDILLGFILGAVSGYMIIGSMWYFVDAIGYTPFLKYVMPGPNDLTVATERMIKLLPPLWLGSTPNIYIAVVLIAVLIIVVFV